MACTSTSSSVEIFKEGLFKDTVWVVTGGGSGIGLEIATQAALLGAHLALCGRRLEQLEEAASTIKKKKTDARVFVKACKFSQCSIGAIN